MISDILSWFASIIINIISATGYFGITILMILESACVPVPSEIVMPFSGYLVSSGRFSFWVVVFLATFGNLIGSLIVYFIGYYGGRPLILRRGKFLISRQNLDRADHWFEKYGSWAIFFSRLMPIVRTFISLPAGVAKMNLPKFITYTFIGSLPWNLTLTYFGLVLGQQWKDLEFYFKKFDFIILILAVLVIIWWIRRELKGRKVHGLK